MIRMPDFKLEEALRNFISKNKNATSKDIIEWLNNRRDRTLNRQKELLSILRKEFPKYHIDLEYVPDMPSTIGVEIFGIDNSMDDPILDRIYDLEEEMFLNMTQYDLMPLTHSIKSTKMHYREIWDKMRKRKKCQSY